jgi:hypothetical protein
MVSEASTSSKTSSGGPKEADAGAIGAGNVKAAAARIGVAPKWLYRRKKTLPFMREIEPGTWRVSVAALERWMHNRGRL